MYRKCILFIRCIIPIKIKTLSRDTSFASYIPGSTEVMWIRESIFLAHSKIPYIIGRISRLMKRHRVGLSAQGHFRAGNNRHFPDSSIIFWDDFDTTQGNYTENWDENLEKIHFYLPKRKIMGKMSTVIRYEREDTRLELLSAWNLYLIPYISYLIFFILCFSKTKSRTS